MRDQGVVVVLEVFDDVGEGLVRVNHSQRPQDLRTDQDERYLGERSSAGRLTG